MRRWERDSGRIDGTVKKIWRCVREEVRERKERMQKGESMTRVLCGKKKKRISFVGCVERRVEGI